MKVSVIVNVSSFGESPFNAIHTIASCRKYVSDVHIVKSGGYSDEDPEWSSYLELLRPLSVTVHPTGTLDLTKVAELAVVEMEAEMVATEGAFEILLGDMMANHKSCDLYAVASVAYIESDPTARWWSPHAWWSALAYGYLVVILVFDTIRSLFHLCLYHRSQDLCARFVYRSFPRVTFLARYRWWTWYFWTGMHSVRRTDGCCIQKPPVEAGWPFVWKTLRTHRGLAPGVWLVAYGLYLYHFLYGPISYLMMTKTAAPLDVWMASWCATHALHFLFVIYSSWLYLDLPTGTFCLLILLYPGYLVTFPVVWLFARYLLVAKSSRYAVQMILNNKKKDV